MFRSWVRLQFEIYNIDRGDRTFIRISINRTNWVKFPR
ncbi:hypothetical protein CKA32_001591 [Geitlerinema sp. FC II]|nr:hypothetical protein CKA32_001591 [Geitlerinema sp. FC II]